MNKKLLLLGSTLVTLVGSLMLLSPAQAQTSSEDNLPTNSGCTKIDGCRVVKKTCWSGWTSTGDPMTWCECDHLCGV